MEKVRLTDYVTKIFETNSLEYSEWFGYYNFDPLNFDGSKMLCNRIKKDGVNPQKGDIIELGYYEIATNKFHICGYSDSWNWQQGAMLQWLPGHMNKNKLIYNTSKEGHLISRIYDVKIGKEIDLSWPIYGLTPDGKKSITLDFERSYWCRAYHYQSVVNMSKDGDIYINDGIFELDIEHNEIRTLIPIQKIIELEFNIEFLHMKHWLEHIMVSPDGSKFVFLHRYSPKDNIFQYKTRVCIANIDGSNLRILSDTAKFERTHFGWSPDNSFAVYSYNRGFFPDLLSLSEILSQRPLSVLNILKRFYIGLSLRLPGTLSKIMSGTRSYYQIFKTNGESFCIDKKKTSQNFYPIDGHPSFTKDGKYIITDSYPDKNQFQHLFILNTENGKIVDIAQLYAYYKGNPASCDLHPKLSRDNKYVVIDTAFDDRHHMIVLEIDWKQIKKKLG